jgi:hypothetical protein
MNPQAIDPRRIKFPNVVLYFSNAIKHKIEQRIKSAVSTADENQKIAEMDAIKNEIYLYKLATIYSSKYNTDQLEKVSSFDYSAKAEYFALKQIKVSLKCKEIQDRAEEDLQFITDELIALNSNSGENTETIDTTPLVNIINTYRTATIRNEKSLNEEIEIVLETATRKKVNVKYKNPVGRPKKITKHVSGQMKITDMFSN